MQHISDIIPIDTLLCAYQRHPMQEPEIGFARMTHIPGVPVAPVVVVDRNFRPVEHLCSIDISAYFIPTISIKGPIRQG